MITASQRDELVHFAGGAQHVLSVYLDLTANRQVQRMYQAAFQDMARRCEAELDHQRAKQLRAEIARVNDFLEGEPHRGQGLSIFSCASADFWRVYFTPVRLDDDIFYTSKPVIRPLLGVLDEYGRYGVALVDSESARLMTVNLGEIEDGDEVADDVTGRHKQGGWSQSRFQRHIDEEIDDHLRHAAMALTALYQRRPFERLVLGGPEEPLARFKELLSAPLLERVIGAIGIEMFANEHEVLERAQALQAKAERKQEHALVDQLLEFAGAGGRGSHGLAPTLDALWNGQVDTLLVARDARMPGAECPNCGRIVASGRTDCPSCSARMEPLDDIVERAIARTLGQSGRVELLDGAAAERLNEAGGGIGAILRYALNPGESYPPDFQTGAGPGSHPDR
jgi:peptide chain release factor subunit 1